VSQPRWIFDRIQVEDEIDTILDTVPVRVYSDEETIALAVLLRPIYERYVAGPGLPGRVLYLVGGAK
jgi:hypothetical protein